MTVRDIPAELGHALPLPTPSPELRRRLAQRRSAPAQTLAAPGPTADEITEILTLGARTPDHGKLFPWRFVVMGPQSRAAIAEQLAALVVAKGLPGKAQAVLAKLVNPPLSILVVFTPVDHAKPVWEQQLSAGAVCMNLVHAAGAFGYSANWITDWYSYDPAALALFGVADGEAVAGFVHIGTTAEPPLERPRPDLGSRVITLP